MALHKPTSFPLRANWDSTQVLAEVTLAHLEAAGDLEGTANLMRFDMETEYDSVNLSRFLDNQVSKGRLTLSPEFYHFRDAWLTDELNHYAGYRKLFGMCCGRSETALHKEVAARPADFGPIQQLLTDEFAICLVIAYDELFTVNSCRQDFPLFEKFGHRCLRAWIGLVARDESFHLRNVLHVLRVRHKDRLAEADEVLDRLVEWDLRDHDGYRATFLLDHDDARYSEDRLRKNCDKILRMLVRSPSSPTISNA